MRNNVIHVSHMFLMKLNLEECGLWWEAAMICEVCVWWNDNEGMGIRDPAGGFPPSAQAWCSDLFTHSKFPFFFFHSVTPVCLAMYFKCTVDTLFVHKHAHMQYLLLAATIYMAKYLHDSQAFRPSLVPTVRPLTHGSQPILSSYRMRQCRTWGGKQ